MATTFWATGRERGGAINERDRRKQTSDFNPEQRFDVTTEAAAANRYMLALQRPSGSISTESSRQHVSPRHGYDVKPSVHPRSA